MAYTLPAVSAAQKLAGQSAAAAIASGTSAAAGKGFLAAIGFSNPITAGIQIGLIAFDILRKLIFKPKKPPLPVKSINITGGREQARYLLGERRVKLEWTDATTLRGGQFRDNYKQFIACVSEGSCDSVLKMWIDQEVLPTRVDPADATHIVPTPGNQFTLPASDVSKYNFPTRYAAEVRYKFMAFGTPEQLEAQAQSAWTTGNINWTAPANRQYNGNPGASDWAARRTERTTEYFDPTTYCEMPGPGGQTMRTDPQYDAQGNPYCPVFGDPDARQPAQVDLDPLSPVNRKFPVALEVKTIDASYRLYGISWIQFNWFEPFYQQDNRSQKLYRAAPEVDLLIRGLKLSTPYRDSNDNSIKHTDPVYTANPMAILYWFDTVYRGVDAALIDDESYLAAYDQCNETITYRYGQATPDDATGADGDWYVRADGHVYQRQDGSWVDLRTVQGDYAWLESQGENGVYEMPRYRCNLEIEIGDEVLDTYRKILATCAGARYPHQGKIKYRVGVDRPVKMSIAQNEILDVTNYQAGIPYNERVNKLSARMSQSEENDWLPDDIEFVDEEAEALDGEPKDAQFDLDGVTNPIQGYNLLSTYLAQMREPMEADVVIDWKPDMVQLDLQPLDIIELNHDKYNWSSTPVEIVHSFVRPDLAVEARVRLFSAKEYKPTLTLPGTPRIPIRYIETPPALDLTGLRAADRLDIRHDSVRTITDAFWNPVVAASTEVEYITLSEARFAQTGRYVITGVDPVIRLIETFRAESTRLQITGTDPVLDNTDKFRAQSASLLVSGVEPELGLGRDVFDESVTLSVSRGILLKQTGLKPLAIAAADGTNTYGTDQTNRYGEWVQYQGVVNTAALPFRQLAFERGSDGIPDGDPIPILGVTDQEGDLVGFRRFGVYAANARSDLAGKTLMQLVEEGTFSTGISSDFTSDQKRDLRIVFKDSGGNRFNMNLPQVSEDPDNPYLWDDGKGLYNFLRAARLAGRTYSIAVVNSANRLVDVSLQRVLYQEFQAQSASLLVRQGSDPTYALKAVRRGLWDSRITPGLDSGVLFRQQNLVADTTTQANASIFIRGSVTALAATSQLYGFERRGAAIQAWLYELRVESSSIAFQVSTVSATNDGSGFSRNNDSPTLAVPDMAIVFNDRSGNTVTITKDDLTGDTWGPGHSQDDRLWYPGIDSAKVTAVRTFALAHDDSANRYDLAVVDRSNTKINLSDLTGEES